MFDSQRNRDEAEESIASKVVKAGRRTYFFDVKATRGDDYFITITESRKKTDSDGHVSYDRSKMFLYKEDFDKFEAGLSEVIEYVKKAKPEFFASARAESGSRHAEDKLSIDEEFERL